MKYFKIALISVVSLFIASTTFASALPSLSVSCNFVANNGGLTPGNTSSMIAGESLSSGTWTASVSNAVGAYSVMFDSTVYGINTSDVIGTWSSDGDSSDSVTKTGSDLNQISDQEVTVTVADTERFVTATCPAVLIYGKLASNSCHVPVSSAVVGQTVNWTDSYTGGTYPYVFTWNGDEINSSFTSSVASVIYALEGNKNASVAGITSGDGQTWSGNTSCDGPVSVFNDSTTIGQPTVLPLSNISCGVSSTNVNLGDTVTWIATISGGLAPYGVDWSGSDGLTGSSVITTIKYTSAGTKTATFGTVADSSGLIKNVSVSCPSVTVNPSTTGGGEIYNASAGNGNGQNSGGNNSCSVRKAGDINCDGGVDISDFVLLMSNWGNTSANNSADLNNDGVVDVLDFNLLMVNWIG
jgi:hypothetical protein